MGYSWNETNSLRKPAERRADLPFNVVELDFEAADLTIPPPAKGEAGVTIVVFIAAMLILLLIVIGAVAFFGWVLAYPLKALFLAGCLGFIGWGLERVMNS